MNCKLIEEKLLSLTAADATPVFSPGERDHLRNCPACRKLEAEMTGAFGRIARAGVQKSPDPAYWSSIVPRFRENVSRRGDMPWWSVSAPVVRALMPAAAVIVVAVLLSRVSFTPPPAGTGAEYLATLSDSELYELRQSGKYTGLLEPVETNVGSETPVADFIADLLSESGASDLYAMVEPEEVLRQVDDEQFAEIVTLMDKH
jgi:hypothetical protein